MSRVKIYSPAQTQASPIQEEQGRRERESLEIAIGMLIQQPQLAEQLVEVGSQTPAEATQAEVAAIAQSSGLRSHVVSGSTASAAAAASRHQRLTERVAELVESTNVLDTEETLQKVIELLRPLPDDEITEAFLYQARLSLRWQSDFCETYAMLSAKDVHELAGSTSKNVNATATRLAKEGRIFGVKTQRGLRYPGFQFATNGRPLPDMETILAILEPDEDPWDIAFWMDTENALLDGRKPAEVLQDSPQRVVDAARREMEPVD